VSKRKISNKRLSHNIKTRKAPLRVLPMTTFHLRHQEKQLKKELMKKQMVEEVQHKPIPPSPVQMTLENIHHQAGRRVKKSWRLKPIIIRPMTSHRSSLNILRWILLVIFVYVAAGTTIVIMHDGATSLKNIVVYSIIGFFTFFMGYLGWILAKDVLEVVSKRKTFQNDAELEG
jgi:hypothetical protein